MKEYPVKFVLIVDPVKFELFPWPVLQGQVASMFVVPLAAKVAAVNENAVAVLALLKAQWKAQCSSVALLFVL